ncbi:uncharacterized protein LOC142575345 isoform X4 [Dermacentor variabilis]|uniref:uncharacterized protein LOC142575345 isoform X4 n=1 Tax=Dermacentor variabilis TaxID=34621 RepID=UPI003F5B26B9
MYRLPTLGEPGVETTTSSSAAQHDSRSADVASRSRYAFRWTKKQQDNIMELKLLMAQIENSGEILCTAL